MTRQYLDWWSFDLVVSAATQRDLWGTLSRDERERAARMRDERHRLRWVVARGRLRQILAASLGCPAPLVRFEYTDKGKPCLADRELKFSLSHAGDRGMAAVTACGEVGIDIEACRGIPDMDRITRRFFSSAECAGLQSLAPDRRIAAFYRVWTRKEAVLKAMGTGLAGGLGGFSVAVDADPPGAPVFHQPSPLTGAWQLCDLPAGPGYAAALAWVGDPGCAVVRQRHPHDGLESTRAAAGGMGCPGKEPGERVDR